MRTDFIKMHGLGNDFVVLDARETALPAAMTPIIAAKLADRREGIGCDQLILLEPSDQADFTMRIFNHDGGEVGACGNAARAVGLLAGGDATIATAGGTIQTRANDAGIAVDMGEPRFDWEAIPLAYAMDTLSLPLAWHGLANPVAVNVGNPHVVFFVDEKDAVGLYSIGPDIENDPVFPERINVNVAKVLDRQTIKLQVWERGAGLTRACGTGACATAVAAMRRGLTDRDVTVHLPGGPLSIAWSDDNRITMTGPATEAFRGSFLWDDYA
ncbi:diaminopimelate epimerase [Aurantiacibacter gangjinensis]|uniref:Diaminopimelate epimerase n=1 Tax=Aurantiacibacter gangjinensis TaxID=502682 RepID=A0A0G9MQT2_9SPHN|nr:diaminopimelate epimerase [Aurantiacibacter gangjinensis]APE28991.1 Diaminopimelate epimerase [Aurantiacibacter gangjinensis]KLE33102.1 diaminopimelate epimerase [Aurantiacibacter gangjinensis]